MFGKFFGFIGFAVFLVSCDKSGDAEGPKVQADSNPNVRRVERPPLAAQGKRGRLRAALDAAKQLEPGEERDQAIANVGSEALESAPDIAAEAIRELPGEGPETAGLIQAGVQQLMERSVDEALDWADSLRDDPWRSLAREQIGVMLAETEPRRAVELLTASNLDVGESNPALDEALQVWAGNAPADAATWASRLPAGEARNAGVKTVVSQWIQTDSAAATSWVKSLSNSNLRQESTRSMAESLQGFPPFIRNSMLECADPQIRSEIEQGIEQLQPAQGDESVPEN